jgi:hypothetical protein
VALLKRFSAYARTTAEQCSKLRLQLEIAEEFALTLERQAAQLTRRSKSPVVRRH